MQHLSLYVTAHMRTACHSGINPFSLDGHLAGIRDFSHIPSALKVVAIITSRPFVPTEQLIIIMSGSSPLSLDGQRSLLSNAVPHLNDERRSALGDVVRDLRERAPLDGHDLQGATQRELEGQVVQVRVVVQVEALQALQVTQNSPLVRIPRKKRAYRFPRE